MSIILHNKIIHILDKEKSNLILTDYESPSTPETDKMYVKLYKSVSKDEFLRKATFNNFESNQIRDLAESIIYYPETFVEKSKEIAKLLFKDMLSSTEIESCSLAVALFSVKDEKKVGIFKLDFKKSLSSKIDTSSNGQIVDIVESNNSFSSSLKSTQATLIGATGVNDEFNLEVLDKKAEKSGASSIFIDSFLDATKVEDDSYKTKIFKQTTENFITNYFYEDAKKAEDARSYLNYVLNNKNTISPNEIIEQIVEDDEYKKEIIEELFEEKNLKDDISVDTAWVEKKTKNITKKLDIGITLKGKLEDFEDPMKYSVSKNEDGSINITLKNVRLIEN